MRDQQEVTILMATYNGAAYLSEQLQSIVKQDYQNWKLVIRDDGSTDQTLKIISEFQQKDPRIRIIEYGYMHGSACKNFSELVNWALANSSGHIMFADQDDHWISNKISRSVEELDKMGELEGIEIPLLCYSGFHFIDEKGTQLPQRLELPHSLELRVLLNENHAWGCTMIFNQATLHAIAPIPAKAVNHDYWVALVVSALGKTKLIAEDLILYRQHTHNVSGNVDNMSFARRFNRYVVNPVYMLDALKANLLTVKLFNATYKDNLKSADAEMLREFLAAYQSGVVQLFRTIFRYRIFKLGAAKNVIYLYTLILLRRKVITGIKAS